MHKLAIVITNLSVQENQNSTHMLTFSHILRNYWLTQQDENSERIK